MRFIALFLFSQTALAEMPPRDVLERYCVSCHDAEVKKGDLDLDSMLGDDIAKNPDTWESVVKQLTARHMPPIGKKRPDDAGYAQVVDRLVTELDQLPPNPGHAPTLRRLTRVEYQNAVRDLLAVEFDA